MYALCQYLVYTPKRLFDRENTERNSIQSMVEKLGLGVRSALLLVVLAVSLLLLPLVLPPLPPPPPCLLLVPVAIMVVLVFLGIFSASCIASDISASHLRFPPYDEMNANASMSRDFRTYQAVLCMQPIDAEPLHFRGVRSCEALTDLIQLPHP